MSWLYYLLEANLYLILFYGLYKAFFQKETFYRLNRFYFIISSLLALVLPFFQLGLLKAPITVAPAKLETFIDGQQIQHIVNFSQLEVKEEFFTVNQFIISAYLLVVIALIVKMALNIFRIIKMKSNSVALENGVQLIELKGSKMAFSFFKFLFIDPHLPNKSTIVKHELAHINQKHSFDVLFFEIIQIINWFNPIVYLLKEDVKLIHEYLADEETTNAEIERYDYAIFLIQNSVGFQNLKLTNQIFGSSTLKKRITMLNQKKSADWARLKLLLVLPLTCFIVCLSTLAFTKNYEVIDLYSNNLVAIKNDTVKKQLFVDGLRVPSPDVLYLSFRTNKQSKKPEQITKRLIVVNGNQIMPETIGGVENADYIISLDAENGIKKYGDKGRFGAIEVVGKNAKILDIPAPPPPPIDPNNPGLSMLVPPPPAPKVKTEKYPIPTTSKNIELNRSKNEKFILPEMGAGRKSMEIFDSKGKRIFSTFNYQNDWDGKTIQFKNEQIPTGKYAYLVLITNNNGKPNDAKKGYLTIL
jgi:hypothetical protein